MTTTEQQAARIAALRSGGPNRSPAGRKERPAARARSFVLGAAITGSTVLTATMWGAAQAATPVAPTSPDLQSSVTAAAPGETVVIRIVRRAAPDATEIRQTAPSAAVAPIPGPATPAPRTTSAATAPPVTRSRASG